ncbi:polysaccharide biosynthesis tyrosine autokinase [Candidatus Igneacidithiobacillus taiwanensis]|uniref:GumC family protein n=1 Tax=Candidatus Igneacidithiobacillus taiwanensis TaxID=1945924 RepID=UPI00289FE75C|nr:polysaccharide biosynthesis tyrosine autokinase [Candidatus Igneacidithiobacillus taiwanensis]
MTDNHTPQTTPYHAVPSGGPKGMTGASSSGDGDEINLGPILQAIREGWKWPVALGGGFAFLAVVIVLFTKPVFNASGTLYLAQAEKNGSAGSGSVDGVSLLSGLLAQGSSMETQVEIINSREMIERAVLASGINAQVWQMGHRPKTLTFAGWKLGGQRLSLYAPGPHALRALYAHVTDPDLQGQTLTIRFGQDGQYQIFAPRMTQRSKTVSTRSYQHAQALLTGKIDQPAVGPELRLLLTAVQPHYIPAAHTQYLLRINNALGVYRALTKNGDISVIRGSGATDAAAKTSYLVTVAVNSTNPFTAKRLTNALMQTYLNQTRSWGTDQAAATYDYLSRQLDKIRTALSNADARLASYQSKSGVIAVSAGAKEMIGQLADYETQRSQAKITLYGLQQIQKTLTQPGGTLNPYLFSSKDPVMNSLATRLADAQGKLIVLEKRYTPAAPQVVQVQADIASIRAAISALVQNQEKMATQQLQSIDAIISQHRADMGKYPRSELEVISLTRSSEVLGKLYMFLLEKQEEAAISKASTLTKNRILDTALIAQLPVAPKVGREVVLYGFLGVLLGLSIVFGRYLLHPGYRSDEELRRRYPFLPVYGLLPTAHSASRSKETAFTMPDPRSGCGEALRLLRGNFYLAVGDARGQVVAMTSAVPGDGKSTLAFQLAAALAQDGKKVLLIDADLRNPHAHLAFQVTQEPGLAGILAGRTTWQAALHHITDLGIDLITAGNTPPNPSEHLGSGRLEQVLAELRSAYDTILIDTPPFPMVGDILTIGPLADRLLTIAKVNHTPRRAYQEHLQGILGLNRPVGLIINGIRVQGSYGYGYGYGASDGKTETPPKGWRRHLRFRRKK